jgi:hypothetical protein
MIVDQLFIGVGTPTSQDPVVDERQWDAISVEEGPPPGKGNLYGFVHDSDGNPLAASSISLNGSETATMLDGTFSLLEIEPGDYTITCTKEGYKDYSKEITVTAGRNDVDIRMLRQEEEESWWQKLKDWWTGIPTWEKAAVIVGGSAAVIGVLSLATRPRKEERLKAA